MKSTAKAMKKKYPVTYKKIPAFALWAEAI